MVLPYPNFRSSRTVPSTHLLKKVGYSGYNVSALFAKFCTQYPIVPWVRLGTLGTEFIPSHFLSH